MSKSRGRTIEEIQDGKTGEPNETTNRCTPKKTTRGEKGRDIANTKKLDGFIEATSSG